MARLAAADLDIRLVYDGDVLMAPRTHKTVDDPGLAQIDDLERRMVQAHDEKAQLGVSAEEVARFRPDVVAQAKAVCDRMRAEHLARIAKR